MRPSAQAVKPSPKAGYRANQDYAPSPSTNRNRDENYFPNISEDITTSKGLHSGWQHGPETESNLAPADNRPGGIFQFFPPSLPIENVNPRLLDYMQNKSFHSRSEITETMLLQGYPSVTDLLNQVAPPTEPRDYHDTLENANKPVRREHFNEYKAAQEDHDTRLRYLLWQAMIDRDLASQDAAFWEHKCKESEKKTKSTGRQRKANDFSQWVSKKRGSINEPRRRDETEQPSESEGEDCFLWNNLIDKLQETHVDTLILRASAMWTTEDWQSMEHQSDKAIDQALELDYTPLIAKCKFYKGVAEYQQRQWAQACASFVDAFSCQGIYPEGSEVVEWLEKARAAQISSPVGSDTFDVGKPTFSWAQSALQGGNESSELSDGVRGENPPVFDEEEDEEEEEGDEN